MVPFSPSFGICTACFRCVRQQHLRFPSAAAVFPLPAIAALPATVPVHCRWHAKRALIKTTDTTVEKLSLETFSTLVSLYVSHALCVENALRSTTPRAPAGTSSHRPLWSFSLPTPPHDPFLVPLRIHKGNRCKDLYKTFATLPFVCVFMHVSQRTILVLTRSSSNCCTPHQRCRAALTPFLSTSVDTLPLQPSVAVETTVEELILCSFQRWSPRHPSCSVRGERSMFFHDSSTTAPPTTLLLSALHALRFTFAYRRRRTTTLPSLCEVSSICCSPLGKAAPPALRSAPLTSAPCGELHKQLPPLIASPPPLSKRLSLL